MYDRCTIDRAIYIIQVYRLERYSRVQRREPTTRIKKPGGRLGYGHDMADEKLNKFMPIVQRCCFHELGIFAYRSFGGVMQFIRLESIGDMGRTDTDITVHGQALIMQVT